MPDDSPPNAQHDPPDETELLLPAKTPQRLPLTRELLEEIEEDPALFGLTVVDHRYALDVVEVAEKRPAAPAAPPPNEPAP